MSKLRASLPKIDNYPAHLDAMWAKHLQDKGTDAPTVISTFAGCGGSSLGYSMAGFRELLAVECDDNAVETFRMNFADVPVYHGDIAKLTVDEVLSMTGLKPGELDIFDGSPPCQGFSTAGKRVLEDDRNQLFREFVRLLQGLKPKVFVMENVSGMVKGKMRLAFVEILKELKASGYNVSVRLLNAMWFGVPQSRQRLIFIGVRDDLGIEPSHPKAESLPVTAGEGVRNVINKTYNRPLATLATSIWNKITPGQNGTAYRAGYYMGNLKVHPNKPSPTIPKVCPGGGGHMHWNEKRTITIEEAARLQSFSENFSFVGSFTKQYERIGNSVPPLMMEAIARHIKENILTGLMPELIQT